MKAKKAVKRLTKVEAILSTVMDEYASENGVKKMLGSAKTSVVRAKEAVVLESSPKPSKKPPVKAEEPKRRIVKKKTTKRKAIGAAASVPLTKTA